MARAVELGDDSLTVQKVIALSLKEFNMGIHQYDVVVLGVENPQQQKSMIVERMSHNSP